MIPTMKTMFEGWLRAVYTGVYPHRQKSELLSIPSTILPQDFRESILRTELNDERAKKHAPTTT